MKFCTRVRLKPSNDRGEFENDRARSKNNIAENSIALGHDTHNRFLLVHNIWIGVEVVLAENWRKIRDETDYILVLHVYLIIFAC